MIKLLTSILERLNLRQRRDLRVVVTVAFLAALCELATVASLYPITQIAFSVDKQAMPFSGVPALFSLTSMRDTALFWASVTFSTVIIALVVRVSAQYAQSTFVQKIRHSISSQLFEAYLHKPYEFFLKRNSSELTKNTLQEADMFAVNGINALIGIAVSLSTIGVTLAFLFFLAPGVTSLFIGVALGLYALFYLGISRLTIRAAQDQFDANQKRHFVVKEGFAMFKEIKANNSEAHFYSKFIAPSQRFSQALVVYEIVANLPRYFIETLLFGGMAIAIGMTFLIMGDDVSLNAALPTIAVSVGATVRVLPAAQTLYRHLISIRNAAPTIQMISDVLRYSDTDRVAAAEVTPPLPFEESITFEQVSFRHDGADRESVSDISVDIPRGAHVGISGETGSGKSTFLDLLMGLLNPTAGHLKIDQTIIGSQNRANWRCNIGYVPQQIVLTDGTIAQNITLGTDTDQIDMQRVLSVARIAQIADFIEGLTDKYDTPVGERGVLLSGGQRQRICIARALYRDPRVLIFDEATSALDIETERLVIAAIKDDSQNRTLIMVAHREQTLRDCDVNIRLHDGRAVATSS
jgi:ABC-type bacteriocin/lantibiotic exporter with double-glycine peptidase domain